MLVTMKEILDVANEQNYAVAAPNVISEIDGRAALETAEDLNAPLILDISWRGTMDLEFVGSYMTRLADQASVPVAINMDHGKDFAQCIHAIRAGFTSLMVDRSTLPFEQNIAEVAEIVRIAHAVNVSVEAELGHVEEGCLYYVAREKGLTDPAQAREFVERAGVDCLAVAVGTAHGSYKGEPRLDFDRITAIKKEVNIPLVIHGASGTGEDKLAQACRLGINKVNVSCDLLRAASIEIENHDNTFDGAYDLWKLIQKGYKRRLGEYIRLFGSDGKAWTAPHSKLFRKKWGMREV